MAYNVFSGTLNPTARLHDTTCCQTGCIHDKTGCQTGCQPIQPVVSCIQTFNRLSSRFDNRLYRVNKHPTGCQTSFTTGWMFVYTIQPVVKPTVQPVRFDNLLCRVKAVY